MRVGIVSLMHESNTFIKSPTTLQHFRDDLLLEGEAIRQQLAASLHEIGGFFGGLSSAGIEAVPIFASRAIPHGPIEAKSFEYLTNQLSNDLASAGSLDGLLVALHGAAVSENIRDADGYVLSKIREVFAARPLILTLDPHANVSQRMVNLCDAIIAYRTNPHIDQRERGVEAAQLISRTLRGEIRPVVRAALPPLVINIERQCTSEPHWNKIHETVNRIRNRPHILSASVVLGFPYADVEEMGAATIVVADNDAAGAQSAADQLAGQLWEQRHDFVGQYIDIDEAIERAVKLPGPVCLLDMGDNTGGGSPADGTWLAHALMKKGIRSFVCIYDPRAARAAASAQPGTQLQLTVGGKTDPRHGPPLSETFRVERIHDGRFEETQVRHGGWRFFDQGLTAIVSHADGLTVMLNSHRMPPFSLQQLLSCGIHPGDYQVVVAKGVNAPLAAYREVCPHLLRVDTPGVTTANLERLEFQHRRRPMFPFEE